MTRLTSIKKGHLGFCTLQVNTFLKVQETHKSTLRKPNVQGTRESHTHLNKRGIYRVSQKQSNNNFFWLWTLFDILDTSWQFWTHFTDVDPLDSSDPLGRFYICWTLLDVSKKGPKGPKGSKLSKVFKVSKRVQICVMCPKGSRGGEGGRQR